MEAAIPLGVALPRGSTGICSFSVLLKSSTKPSLSCFGRVPGKLTLFPSRAVSEDRADATPQWQLDFLGASAVTPDTPEDEDEEDLLPAEATDWCVRARRSALRSIEERGLAPSLQRMVSPPKKKKKKKTAKKKEFKKAAAELKRRNKQVDDAEADEDDDDDYDVVDDLQNMDDLELRVAQFADGMFDEKRQRNREAFVQTLSRFSATPSNRSKEVSLNRTIIQAQTANEVLDLTAEVITGSPLSPRVSAPRRSRRSTSPLRSTA
jgi:hypothetical protein